MWLQVERAELVEADHHIGVAALAVDLAVSEVVEVQDPVLLRFVVGVVGSFEGVHDLKRHALLAEQKAETFVADVVDHPLRDEVLAELGQRPRRERQVVIGRTTQCDLFDLAALIGVELRWSAACVFRIERVEPVGVEVVDHLPSPILRREPESRYLRHIHLLR
jgi:hypothetical protein